MNRLFIIFLLSIVAATAQRPVLEESANIFEYEEKINQWRAENPSNQGWGWQSRQQNEIIRRADENGKLPPAQIMLDATEKINRMARKSAAQSAWLPAGPYGNMSLFGIGRASCIAFHPKDSLTFYLGFGQGGIWKTTNGGKNYTPIGDQLPVLRISAITVDPNNPETIYIAVGDFAYIGYDLYSADRKRNTYYGVGVYKSTDGGKNWKASNLSRNLVDQQNSLIRTIWVNPKNSAELVVVGMQGIFRSADAGGNWTKVSDFLTSQLIQHPTKPAVLYAAGIYVASTRQGEANILQSLDAGLTWTRLNTGIPPRAAQRVEMAISSQNPNVIYAITCNTNSTLEGFYKTIDGGQNWAKSTSKTQVLSDSPTGTYGQGMYDLTLIVNPENANHVVVGGLVLFDTKNGGDTWTQATPYTGIIHPDQHFLAYNPLNKSFFLCNDGGLYRTKNLNNSNTWEFLANDINVTSCYRLGLSVDGKNIVTGAQDNNSFYKEGTNPWESLFGGDGMECAILPDAKTVYLSAQYGTIAYLSNSRYYYVFPPSNNEDTGEWTTPFSTVPATNEVLIAGGNVYKVPFGQPRTALKRISNFPVLSETKYAQLSSALGVSKTSASTIYVAKRSRPLYGVNAEFWVTKDGGGNWAEVGKGIFGTAYISAIAVDDDNADNAWVALSNFKENNKIFATNDAGQTWQNISYNLPNIPANGVVYQPEVGKRAAVLYAAMDIGVYYLVEGQTEWKLLNANLPNVIVSELEINVATNKIYAATFGRGIWLTDLVDEQSKTAANFYEMEIIAYPNPVRDGILSVKANYDAVETISIFNSIGVEVYTETLKKKALKLGKKINVQHLPSGLHYVRLTEGKLSKTVRVLVY